MANLGILGPLLMGVILIGVAGRQFYAALGDWRFTARVRSWPTTSGMITHSRVRQEAPDDDPTYSHAYVPDIRFRYTVGERTYTTTDFDYRDPDTEESVIRLVDRYPLNSIVIVHYDPDTPRRAYLDPGSLRSLGTPLVIGGIALITGLVLVIVSAAQL